MTTTSRELRRATTDGNDRAGAPSRAQQALWLLEQTRDLGSSHNLPLGVELRGAVDEDALRAALARAVARHPALRTQFEEQAGRLVRHELGPGQSPALVIGIDALGSDIDAEIAQRSRAAIDPLASPPYTATLLRAHRRTVLLLVLHHCVFDGTSKDVLLDELAGAYSAAVDGIALPEPDPGPSYDAYVAEEERLVRSELGQALAAWRPMLSALDGTARLFPLPGAEPPGRARGASRTFVIDAELKLRIDAMARANDVSTYVALLSVLHVLLHRYAGSGHDPVATAIELGTRPRAFRDSIGMFVNEAPLVTQPSGSLPFRDFLHQVDDRVQQVLRLRRFPFSEIAQHAPEAKDGALEVSVGYRRAGPLQEWSGLDAEPRMLLPHQGTRWPLGVQLLDEPHRILGRFDYDPAAVPEVVADGLGEHLLTLMRSVTDDPSHALNDLAMLRGDASPSAASHRHRSRASIGDERAVDELFEQQVRRTPGQVALASDGGSVTYEELNRRANRLAHRLIEEGVREETVVGLHALPGHDLVVGLLATLKAGGAYLPLDPTYPDARLGLMARDAGVELVLDTTGSADRTIPANTRTVAIAEASAAGAPDHDPEVRSRGDALAFVLYTSGSTGTPKGVQGLHRTIVSRVGNERFAFAPAERLCLKTSISFIDSLWEIFAALTRGLTTVIAPASARRDPAELVDLLGHERITRVVGVPSQLRAVLRLPGDLDQTLPSLRYWMSTGEPLAADLCDAFFERLPHAALVNLYGTSECWDATAYDCRRRRRGAVGRVPIGEPLALVEAHVLDQAGRPVPPGVPGELSVGGPGVARGYLHRPDLTRERFVRSPHGPLDAWLYRTGDRVRDRGDGALELLGRTDHQVKIRGHRVELSEVEATLVGHPGVRQAVAAATDEGEGTTRLVGYVVPDPQRPPLARDLRTFLRDRLPEALVPASFVMLSELPATPSGKLDRSRLPKPHSGGGPDDDYVAPRTELERKLARLWGRVLRQEAIGIADDFFGRGGDSLAAAELVSLVADTVGVTLPVRCVYRSPTIAELALEVAAREQAPTASIPRARRRTLDRAPASGDDTR